MRQLAPEQEVHGVCFSAQPAATAGVFAATASGAVQAPWHGRRGRSGDLVQQARRLADRTAFFLDGELVEVDRTEAMFSETPADPRTFQYVRGIFG